MNEESERRLMATRNKLAMIGICPARFGTENLDSAEWTTASFGHLGLSPEDVNELFQNKKCMPRLLSFIQCLDFVAFFAVSRCAPS